MNAKQIAWAKAHDWFLYVGIDGASVIVLDRCVCAAGHLHEKVMYFTNFRELRVWAGY